MFVGNEIDDLVRHLDRRQASLWHACQLNDLAAYLALGGVPTRSLVERRRLSQTAFVTDSQDRINGVWDKVFCNLDDFGRSFALGWKAVPNPYGPITLQIRPQGLIGADDVAIALRSAGAHDFDREGESLSTLDEIDKIYRHGVESGFPMSVETKFGDELQRAFASSPIEAKSAEVSVSLPEEMIGLAHVTMVTVEPLVVGDVDLVNVVRALVHHFGWKLSVRPRLMGERREVWSDLVRFLADGSLPFIQVSNRADASPATRDWIRSIGEKALQWQFDRFARYLCEGTLEPLAAAALRSGSVFDEERTRRNTPAPFQG